MPINLQEQARALGDPTRHAIFEYLRDAPGQVGVAELTLNFDLNHNAIRQHLAKLVDAGLATEAVAAPHGRGRPPLVYELHPRASDRWGVAGPYERLSAMLAEIIATGTSPGEVGRRAGAQRAGSFAPGTDALAALDEVMTGEGFDPAVDTSERPGEMVLHTCPYATTADRAPSVVCELHLGLAQGLCESIGGITIDRLVVADPHSAGCRLVFHADPVPLRQPAR